MKKIMIICSTSFYDRIPEVEKELKKDFEIIYPNGYLEDEEEVNWDDIDEYSAFFKRMFKESREKVEMTDCCLVLNFDKVKNGTTYKNYIGASTFLEMYEAFMLDKEIYMYNGFPDKANMLYDEIKGVKPIYINGNLSLIKR